MVLLILQLAKSKPQWLMHSLWEKDSFYASSDVIVIGAGITGLSLSIELKEQQPNLNIRVVEAGSYPRGASVKNAGFACFGSLSELLDDISNEGEEKALNRISDRYRGIQKLLQVVDPKEIDYLQHDGFEVFTQHEKELMERCQEEIDGKNQLLNHVLGFQPYQLVENSFGFNTSFPLIKIAGEGALHSGKLMSALLKKAYQLGVQFTFGFKVTNFEKDHSSWKVYSSSDQLACQQLVIATNGFSRHLLPNEDIVPARGQILLTTPIDGFSLIGTFHAKEGYYYFREINNRLLLGGARDVDKPNESTDDQNTTSVIQDALETFAKEVILPGKGIEIEKRWAGTMAFGSNNEKDAIVKQRADGLIIAARLGGMGVAMAPIVAEKASNLLLSH